MAMGGWQRTGGRGWVGGGGGGGGGGPAWHAGDGAVGNTRGRGLLGVPAVGLFCHPTGTSSRGLACAHQRLRPAVWQPQGGHVAGWRCGRLLALLAVDAGFPAWHANSTRWFGAICEVRVWRVAHHWVALAVENTARHAKRTEVGPRRHPARRQWRVGGRAAVVQ